MVFNHSMDLLDLKIIESLLRDSETPLLEIGKKCGINSSSAISKRIRKMKEDGIILKSEAVVNYDKLGFEFVTVTFIKAKFGHDYTSKLAEKLLSIDGIITLLEILGETDFIMIALNKSQKDYRETLSYLMSLEEIERSDTRVVINGFRMHDLSNLRLFPGKEDIIGER